LTFLCSHGDDRSSAFLPIHSGSFGVENVQWVGSRIAFATVVGLVEPSQPQVHNPWELADPGSAGRSMHDLVRELYPICRSITGEIVRDTWIKDRAGNPVVDFRT
jgi:hypothetical protein